MTLDGIMNKQEIISVFGSDRILSENSNGTALSLSLKSEQITVKVTIPLGVHELFFEARDTEGSLLVKDWHDFYGEEELVLFKDSLQFLASIPSPPEFTITNNGGTIKVRVARWEYFFGEHLI